MDDFRLTTFDNPYDPFEQLNGMQTLIHLALHLLMSVVYLVNAMFVHTS